MPTMKTPFGRLDGRYMKSGRSASLVVAASNSLDKCKWQADYVCDGTADEVEINAAIQALPAGGGRVLLMEGTYYINAQIEIDADYVTLEGQGMGTLLKVPDSHASTMVIIYCNNAGGTITGIQVKNLRIDGNRSNVTGTYYIGVDFNDVTDSTIDGVFLSNGKGSGGDGYAFLIISCTDIVICNCTGEDWDYEPIELRTSSNIIVTDCIFDYRIELYDDVDYVSFTNNIFIDMEFYVGVATGGGGFCNQIRIAQNYFYTITDRGSGYGIVTLARAYQAQVVGNQFYIDGTNANGITTVVAGNYHLLENNYFYLAKSGANGIYSEFVYCNITGNYIYHGQANSGIVLISGGSYNNISGNYGFNIDPWSYGTILIDLQSGADENYVHGNVGYNASNHIQVASDNNIIEDNILRGGFNRGILISGDSNRVRDNHIAGTIIVAAIVDSGSSNIYERNVGWASENSGTATVANGQTLVDVTHGLAITPSINDIHVTPTNSMGNATKYYISNVGATTFRINVDIDPGATTATFVWQIGSY